MLAAATNRHTPNHVASACTNMAMRSNSMNKQPTTTSANSSNAINNSLHTSSNSSLSCTAPVVALYMEDTRPKR